MNKRHFKDDPEYVKERRQVLRANHPDLGGSDEQLIKALASLDAKWQRKSNPAAQVRERFIAHRPDFIPEDVAHEAFDAAEVYADQVQRLTEDLLTEGKRQGKRLKDFGVSLKNQQGRDAAVRNASRFIVGSGKKARDRVAKFLDGGE